MISFVARFIPVPRINRLLVLSHSEAAWSYAMKWLERIDTYAEGPRRRIFVYRMEAGIIWFASRSLKSSIKG